MQKAILGGLAALLLSAAAASAATSVSIDGFCNVYSVRKSGDGYVLKDTVCGAGIGAGDLVSIRGAGKTVIFGLYDPASPGVQFSLKLSYPFVTGGTWSLEKSTDGVHLIPVVTGTYSLPAAAQRGLHGTKSVTSK